MAANKAGKFSKRAQESSLGQLVDQVLKQQDPRRREDLGSELDFITSPTGLGITLYPTQRIIVKAAFGIPLDYHETIVPVWDAMKENLLYEMTETQFVRYLFDQGRCNVEDWRDIPKKGFGTLVLYAGRRGGKSQVVSGIGASCLRNLLAVADPQHYYGLVKGAEISFTMMGTDEDSSDRLYQKLRADVNGSPFFTPYIRNNDELEMRFVTERDRDGRDVVPSISVKAYPCTTRSARGPSNYFLALDEFQFFRSSKDANSDDLYKAATPSTSQFAPPDDPENADSKIIVISSPSTRVGKMYELHRTALEEGISSNIFTMRVSTVEMNPRIPRSKLAQDLKENPDTFKAEFGGNFLDGSGSYVPEIQVEHCIDKGRENLTRFSMSTVGRKYFWGLDLGMKNDATALAIGHLEMVEGSGIQLIYDYIDRMMVGERYDGPGVDRVDAMQKYDGYKELDVVDIVKWLYHMQQILPCFQGATDQHAGAHFKQLLQINGIVAMELRHLNDQINSKMYFALQGMVNHAAARFPDVPKFILEFKMLEATYRNKYVLSVEARSEKGAHDDMSDAAALVALLAQEWLEKEGKLDLDPTGRVLQVNPNLFPPVPISDINGVSMRDLQVMERTQRILHRQGVSARSIQRNSFAAKRLR